MVIPTLETTQGILLEIYQSFLSTNLIATYLDEIGNYSHTIAAIGGFERMSADLTLAQKYIDEWIEMGLGRKVVAKAADGSIIWEGMVNQVTAQYGGITLTRGPLIDIANRVSVAYTPILDPTTNPPITGERTETIIADDADSQAIYGIWEVVIDGGNLLDDGTTDDAEQLRDTYLAQYKWPETSVDITAGENPGETRLSIECVGLYEYLRHYIFNDENFLSEWVITKLTDVLDAAPSAFFSADRSRLEDNLMLVSAYEDQNRSAGDIIKELLDIGDASDNRYIFGFYENGVPVYNVIPSTIEYKYTTYRDSLVITWLDDSAINPWIIRPGQWIILPDILIGRSIPTSDLRVDPRAQFIESVTFNTPDKITIETSRIRTITQMMNRIAAGSLV